MELLQTNYASLLETGDLSDVTFIVQGKEFLLHKIILAARSPVFKAMFTNKLEESTKNRVEIPDIAPEVFDELLRYIYSGIMPSMEKYNFQLFIVADKYQLNALKQQAAQSLSSTLSTESVINILVLADMHSEAELKLKCIEFVSANSVAVQATDSWKELVKEKRADLLAELFQAIAAKYVQVSRVNDPEQLLRNVIVNNTYTHTLIELRLQYPHASISELIQRCNNLFGF